MSVSDFQNSPNDAPPPVQEASVPASKTKTRSKGTRQKEAAEAARRYPRDPLKQIAFTLGTDVPAATGRPRSVGDRRFEDMHTIMGRAVTCLGKLGVRVQDVRTISRKNVLALCVYWIQEREVSHATLEQYVSTIRRYMVLIGKPDCVPAGKEWRECLKRVGLEEIANQRRVQLNTYDKSWAAHGVDPEEVIEAIKEESPVVSAALGLIYTFGLRASEAYQLEPERSAQEGGLYLWKTKGGRPRHIPYSLDAAWAAKQRRAVDVAIRVAQQENPKRRVLAEKGLTPRQTKTRFYTVLTKFGITKAESNVTVHGLRNEYAMRMFRDLTGLPAPVEAAVPASEYFTHKDLVHAAREQISLWMGHVRAQIVKAYTGSEVDFRKAEERLTAHVGLMMVCLGQFAPDFLRVGITKVWVMDVSKTLLKRSLRAEPDSLLLAVSAPDLSKIDLLGLHKLLEHVSRVACLPAGMMPWPMHTQPDCALLVFDHAAAAPVIDTGVAGLLPFAAPGAAAQGSTLPASGASA